MTKIFWDTNLFIYLFEENAEFAPRVIEIRKQMKLREYRLYTSALTVGEILVKPSMEQNASALDRYQIFFQNPAVTVVPFDITAAKRYAQIRRDRSIRAADAIQLACAAAAETDLFITNDARLAGKSADGIKFMTTLQRAPL